MADFSAVFLRAVARHARILGKSPAIIHLLF